MDTNLKKTHKLAVLIITLVILGAALSVTCLYPRTGVAMEKLRNRYQESNDEMSQDTFSEWCVQRNVVNYAVEASYYMYGFLLQECEKRKVDFSVLDEYGWDSDYHKIISDCVYLAVYQSEEAYPSDDKSTEQIITYEDALAAGSNESLMPLLQRELTAEEFQEMDDAGYKAYLILEFDAYGKLAVADLKFTSDKVRYYDSTAYMVAKASVEQYANNVIYYGESDSIDIYEEVIPKNFRAVFLIHEDSEFIYEQFYGNYNYIPSSEHLYWETGAFFLILAVALIVAVIALLLPFIKPLNTGWERIFSIHIETLAALCVLGTAGAYGMMICMANTNTYEILQYVEYYGTPELLGYELDVQTIYYGALTASFIGWAVLFFGEYIAVSSFRQFLARPGYYLSHRFLCINILKWPFKKSAVAFKKLYNYVADIDITEKLNRSIIKIVLANFVIITILSCFWFFGIIGGVIYTAALYLLMMKYGSRLQAQYHSIINATKKMAEGDLKIEFEDDLGMFEPLGDTLTKIQQGFSKAVAEEAKSQQMKTELITNVSHDLKTPLTAIITYVNLLKNPDITEDERKIYVETLDQKSQRLKILIEDLFEVSKAQSGNIQMNFMDVDVVNLMKQVRLEMEDQIAESGLLFRWKLPDEKITLSLDGQKTYRIFVNLINNILKYSMSNSRVFIDIIPAPENVQVCFKNISMTELDFDAERLTDRFVRGDASRNTDGSGLGLAIAKSFAELQNGIFKIDVDGDLFKVTIIWPR